MASPSQTEGLYDVFLSFRGPDTRHSFVSHLYRALDQRGIHAFKDDEKLDRGERISQALINAIKNSRIAVIIFSQNFAFSSWCLDEVAKIMDCKEANKLIVMPVFYYVDPKEVRGGRHKYKEAFVGHERKYGNDSEEVKKWRKALKAAGNLFGSELNVWVITKLPEDTHIQLESREFKVMVEFRKGTPIQLGNKEFKDEAQLVESIVREIWIKVSPPLYVARHPVDIDPRVDELKSLLNMKLEDKVLTIGIWAMPGMGKTVLATALYNSIFKDFEGSAFIDGIRGTLPETENMVRLQQKLLSEVLMTKDITLTSDAKGRSLIAKTLSQKRVLLVLDGVDDVRQMKALAGEDNWFGKGSRIIVTTTNKGVLNSGRDPTYKVTALGHYYAHKLFLKYASENQNIEIKEDLVGSALKYAEGHPFALETLGRAFTTSERSKWESEPNGIVKECYQIINGRLRTSYDGLGTNEKEIFLHIACFFNGWRRKYVECVLGYCDIEVAGGIDYLIQRSLIWVENGILKMQDLVERLGKDIVNRDFPYNPEKRSRLWHLEDVDHVLSGNKETETVKAIVLAPPNRKKLEKDPKAFANFTKLEFLIMINVETDSEYSICLPSELRWFEWPKCRASSLKFTSIPEKLAVLAVREHPFKEPEEP